MDPQTRTRRINTVGCVILVGFVAAAFFNYVNAVHLGKAHPYNTFLFAPADRFMDFAAIYRMSTDPNIVETPARCVTYNYPPIAYLLALVLLLDRQRRPAHCLSPAAT